MMRTSFVLAISLWLAGCGSSPVSRNDLNFVRGGVVVAGGRTTPVGVEIGGGRRFVPRLWSPGETVVLAGSEGVAPQQPSCVSFFEVPLGDVSSWIGLGGATPDTSLAFSPDGTLLAIGSWLGDVWIVDGYTGKIVAKRHLSESLIKQVRWSADGGTLYAAEQSPDAWVHALRASDLTDLATLRLADYVASSAPPPGDDLYGLYTLPAAYALERLPGDEWVVVATHGWNTAKGVRQNRTRVLRLAADLQVLGQWPEDEVADAVILGASVRGHRIAVAPSRSATTPTSQTLPLDGVQVLTLPELQPVEAMLIPPLSPWFKRSFVWNGLDFDEQGRVTVGLGDGRLVRPSSTGLRVHGLSSPIDFGGVAVVSSIGSLKWRGSHLWVSTSGSNIPWGTADPSLRPPQPHPNENALFELTWSDDDEVAVHWAWRGPQQLAGFTLGEDGHTLVMGAGPRITDTREDLFGALVVDLRDEPGERAATWCPTEGPVFFRQAVAPDGRFAVAEVPFKRGEQVVGNYRVTVFR